MFLGNVTYYDYYRNYAYSTFFFFRVMKPILFPINGGYCYFINHVTIVIMCQNASAPGGVSLRAEGRKRRVGRVTACVTRQEGVFH